MGTSLVRFLVLAITISLVFKFLNRDSASERYVVEEMNEIARSYQALEKQIEADVDAAKPEDIPKVMESYGGKIQSIRKRVMDLKVADKYLPFRDALANSYQVEEDWIRKMAGIFRQGDERAFSEAQAQYSEDTNRALKLVEDEAGKLGGKWESVRRSIAETRKQF